MIGKLTLFTSTKPATLGKTFRLGVNGVEKTTAGEMVQGRADVQTFANVEDLARLLTRVRTDQAITTSVPINGVESAPIVTKAMLPDHPGALTRSKDHFHFPANQPGVFTLDYDPPEGVTSMQREDLWRLLLSVVPAVADTSVLWWCSGSSHIYHNAAQVQGLRGQRLYLLIRDLADTERFGKVLAQRLWLAGHGRIAISASGQKLLRSTFDEAMFQAARLDFCGGAVCEAPLEQRRGDPVVLASGGWLDTRAALPDLDDKELLRFEGLVEDARAKAEPEAQRQREAWVAKRLEGEVQRLVKTGVEGEVAVERATRTLQSALNKILLGDFELQLADGCRITVSEALNAPERFHEALTRDPLEPEYQNGKVTGKLYLYGAIPVLHSFAHGSKSYWLRRQPARLYVQRGRKAELADQIRALLANEPDVFRRGGAIVRVVDGRVRVLRKAGLMHLIGSRVALYAKDAKGRDVPADLPADVADMVSALVEG